MRIIPNHLSGSIHIPRFVCDGELHEQLRNTNLPNNHHFMYIVGRARSGKTSLAVALLSQIRPKIYRRVFNHILCFVPRSSLMSLQKNVFESLDENKKFDELSLENLEQAQEMIDGYREADEKSLIYMDDVTSSLKDTQIQRSLKNIVFNRRHKFCSIWCLSQSYLNLPRDLRKQVTHIILFKPSMIEYQTFVDEYLTFLDKNQIKELYRTCFNEPHSFLYYNTETSQIYRKFDLLDFENEPNEETK